MGMTRPARKVPCLIAALAAAALALPAGASGAVSPYAQSPKAKLATTGNNSERLRAIPISKKPAKRERVAMSLSPNRLNPIAVGDRLRVSAEVQFSTTCVKDGPRCVGSSYDFNPSLSARIVLAPSPEATAASFPLSTTVKRRCKQRRPNRNHHCTLVISNNEVAITPQTQLPCPSTGCYVNLIVGAWHKKAKKTNRVVLGADRPDGSVAGDKGRLNVVQVPAGAPDPIFLGSADLVNAQVPLTEGKKEKRRVVYSVPIVAPKRGEVIAFDASYVSDLTGLRFNTFVSSRVILAETPTSTVPTGLAKAAAKQRGEATESNGFNCTLGRSGYANPCLSLKAGATKIRQDAIDVTGLPATLYLNVVAAGKPLLADRLKGAPLLNLQPAEGLRVLRYVMPS